jgi:hypothetical protein
LDLIAWAAVRWILAPVPFASTENQGRSSVVSPTLIQLGQRLMTVLLMMS